MTNDLVFNAMSFARSAHSKQKRKYTGVPYFCHLAEVAGIVSSIHDDPVVQATAWLHDCIEDQGVPYQDLVDLFGETVAQGVLLLSNVENGNRATRKAAERARLSNAEGWIQNIKCADVISNASSIRLHDPEFAILYLEEKRELLNLSLTRASRELRQMALSLTLPSVDDDREPVLRDFTEGQWWVRELDTVGNSPQGSSVTVTPDLKRSVAVVHRLLSTIQNLDK